MTGHAKVRATIDSIPDDAWVDIDYTAGGHAQVAECDYVVGGGTTKRKVRTVRLVVRRTRLADPAPLRLWPDWRHHAFITNRDDLNTIAADQFHREHAVVELAIRDLKAGAAEHIPSGHYPANAAWLGCAVIAHNLTRWTTILGGQPTVTNTTFRTRITAVPAGELAKEFIADTYRRHNIKPKQLALHADRGTSMTSKPVAQLLVDLGVERSHSRPHVSNDNPYSEAAFKTLKYCPAFPGSFGSLADAKAFCQLFFDYYNNRHYSHGVRGVSRDVA